MADITQIDFGDGVTRNIRDDTARTDLAAKENLKLASSGTTASGEIRFGVDGQGNYGYIKAGADTVTPFRTGGGNLQEKTTTVTPAITTNASATTTQSVEISPDTGYDGMSKVNVSTPQQHINGLVNVNGVSYGGSVWNGDTEETYNDKMLIVTPSKDGMAYTRASNGLLLVKPSASMGNATAADVRQGKTFTSGSGIAQTGSLVVPASVYGVTWDGGSSPAWTRTDGAANFSAPNPYYSGMSGTPSSPFDAIMPWAGMRKVTSNSDVLVEIPKFWYKWTRSGASMQLQISNQAETGFYVSPAHADRGDGVGERDYVYVGRYHCSGSSASMYNYKSLSGVAPKGNETRATFRSGIHNLGANYWQWDFAMYWTIAMLYLVEFANWNSQAMIGYGCGNGSSAQNTGASDTMPYHTGTMQSSRSTYGVGTQYRYIEDLWGNIRNWCDGIYFSGTNIYCIKNPADFSDNNNGQNVGSRTSTDGWIMSWNTPVGSGFEYALYPSSASLSLDGTTYSTDYASYTPTSDILAVGANYAHSQVYGLFYLNGGDKAATTNATIGSRLMVLPSAQLT
jgi:hypothetical protein